MDSPVFFNFAKAENSIDPALLSATNEAILGIAGAICPLSDDQQKSDMMPIGISILEVTTEGKEINVWLTYDFASVNRNGSEYTYLAHGVNAAYYLQFEKCSNTIFELVSIGNPSESLG